MTFRLSDYDVSPTTGFLSECDARLPPHFAVLQQLVDTLPALLKDGMLVQQLDALPLFDANLLTTNRELKTAYSVLAFLVNAYVWHNAAKPHEVVPRNLAVVFKNVSERLGIASIATYATVCLYNWSPKTVGADITNPDSLRCWHRFTMLKDEEWFYMVHVAMEAMSGNSLCVIERLVNEAPKLSTEDYEARQTIDLKLQTDLEILASTMGNISKVVGRMYEHCDPQIFFDGFRPFLGGWNAKDRFPSGVTIVEPTFFAGGSAAQSSLIQAFDKILGVTHLGGNKAFLDEMLKYMPRDHRNFLITLGERGIRAFVSNYGSRELINTYNRCIAKLMSLRQVHLGLTTSYVINQLKRISKKTDTEIENEAEGLGGTKLKQFLEGMIKETEEAKL